MVVAKAPRAEGRPAWYVISLRPLGTHGPVRRAATRHGARVFACSSLRLVPLACPQLDAALRANRVLFTSPAAVRFASRLTAFTQHEGQSWLAVGSGTAAQLRARGVAQVAVPARMDTEGLLAHEALQSLAGTRVGVVGAPGGRDLIASALRGRGAEVLRADVYRREVADVPAARLAALATLPPATPLLVSSASALVALLGQLEESLMRRLRSGPVVVSSARLDRIAQDNGFARTHRAESALPGAMLAAAADAVAAGFR